MQRMSAGSMRRRWLTSSAWPTDRPTLGAFAAAGGKRKASTSDAIAAFADFHRPPEKSAAGRKTATDNCPDFHQVVAGLGSHPRLMRRLGLVFDLELPLDELGLEELTGRPVIRAVPLNAAFDGVTHQALWSAVEYDTDRSARYRTFRVASHRKLGSGGLSALGAATVSITQERLEHATFALMQQEQLSDNSGQAPPTMPALLQGGMRVAHDARPIVMRTAMGEQSRLSKTFSGSGRFGVDSDATPSDQETILADHVNRGFRVDVQNVRTGQWRSLCRRHFQYRVDDDWSWPAAVDQLEDEGTLEPVIAEEPRSTFTVFKMTDDLFEWDGWSLVVQRRDDNTVDAEQAQSKCSNQLTTRYQVPPGSLEPQRFGETYRFRLRSVDLAGNSLSVAEANALDGQAGDGATVTPQTPCLRVESVKPPVVVRGQPRGIGEAGDLVVLRDADAREHQTAECRLHLAPPDVSYRIAEKHGLFDDLSDSAAWQLIDAHRRAPGRDENGDPIESIEADEFYTPYLADPLAGQAVLILPDGGGVIDLPRFDDIPWLQRRRELARSCRLIIRKGRDRVRARVDGRTVVVEVPPGRLHTLQLAARLEAADLDLLALARKEWLGSDTLETAANREVLIRKAARGETPLLAPAAELKVLYATQRPLRAPAFGRPLIMPRTADATSALLADDALIFDRPSTGRIDVYARWEDPVDDPDQDGWQVVEREIYAGGVRIGNDDNKPLDPIELAESPRSPLAHDLGDTRHHRITYTASALSRFVEFYVASLTEDPQNTTLRSEPVTLDIPATAPPAIPDIAFVLPTFADSDMGTNAAGEQTRRRSGSGLRLYMNRGWFSSGDGEQLALVLSTTAAGSADLPVCEWGENPLHEAAPLPGPLRLQHVWSGADRIDRFMLDEQPVALAIHDVAFSEEHGLPFVDIEFLAQRAFMPMVRLAVARFQKHAIDGCHLSAIAQADFVPLAPGRALTVRQSGIGTWGLVLRGFSFQERHRLTRLPTTVVMAHIECMPIAQPDDPAAWRAASEPVQLSADAIEPWHFQWGGRVEIADTDLLTRHWRRRLVIQEFEPFASAAGDDLPVAERSRLVYAQTVPLT